MIKLGVIIGLCSNLRYVDARDKGNTTKGIEEHKNDDNIAESSDLGGNLFDLGSVSSGLLSSGLNFRNDWTPITAPVSSAEPHLQSDEHVKTITVTKNVPVPYTVTVEKRVPVRIEVPVDKPYPVYVPRPYQVIVEKKVPYHVKVPVPQPYTVEKHVPVPVKIHVARPYPVQVPAPYPVFMVRKVPYTIEKHIPFPVGVPVVRPYPVHVPVEKHVPFPVEKTVPYPVKIHVDRPVPVHVEKPYPVRVEKLVPVQVEKLIPVPVKIPVRVPIPFPVPHHTHEGSPSNNEYYIHEQLQQTKQPEYQFHSEGETKTQENAVGESETLVRHEVPDGVHQGEEQNRFHYERIPAFQQPQAYPQQDYKMYVAPHESEVTAENESHQPVGRHGYQYHHHQDEETYSNEAKNQPQFLSVHDYSKALHDQYVKQMEHEETTKKEVQQNNAAKDEYEALKVQSDDGEGKQESYFKVNMGESAYTNSVHHGLRTTGR
ncbi:hypothetical protein GE061_009911 [Apolygus lucorum]|uniref:Uncharacterized protein n=1 Tax=Apolygus lucorum TaxID=248454 RepID=A0A6A4JND6_APOLU|nr:hypothetical protein GE061_009911 [Apolygus lucorum]